jgi:hypothetical protein
MAALPLFLRSLQKEARPEPALSLTWPELEAALPDGGLPRGVVELSAPYALGGASTIAACAVRSAQARDVRAWCAWIDPEASLYAPGLHARGIDLARLFVIRPARKDLQPIALKCVISSAFDVVVVDLDPIGKAGTRKRNDALFVRKLALGAEKAGTTVLLLVDASAKKSEPWPTTLRLELERTPKSVWVRIGKDRHGRASTSKTRIRMELLHG